MFLFYGSILMLRETRMATATINAEMDFTWELAERSRRRKLSDKYTYNAHGKRRFETKVSRNY